MGKKGIFMMTFFIGVMLVLGGGKVAAGNLIIQNSTGFKINYVEYKLSSSNANTTSKKEERIWASLLGNFSSIAHTKSMEFTLPPGGTYDIRVRTGGGPALGNVNDTNGHRFFVIKNVKITDAAKPTINFTADNKYFLKENDFKEVIQDRCRFGNAVDVWKVLDPYNKQFPKTYEKSFYQVWAESYGKYLYAKKPNKTDQEIINAALGLKGDDGANLSSAIDKHKFADTLRRVWADTYSTTRD